ncbi:MAG: hypothetical protein RIC14_07290 [Filomicrobium sp.]
MWEIVFGPWKPIAAIYGGWLLVTLDPGWRPNTFWHYQTGSFEAAVVAHAETNVAVGLTILTVLAIKTCAHIHRYLSGRPRFTD